MDMSFVVGESIKRFVSRVYAWMALALAITATTAYFIAATPGLFVKLFSIPGFVIGIFIVQLGFVFALSMALPRMSYSTAIITFLGYALSVGITFSAIFFTYSLQSILTTFAICASMFGTMALYGAYTKADLTNMGNIARMGLFGLIISLVVNIFLQSATFDYFISMFGVIVFTALTAYDMQKIVHMGYGLSGREELQDKFSIFGALTLYLDFINLFLMLLRFTGGRRK